MINKYLIINKDEKDVHEGIINLRTISESIINAIEEAIVYALVRIHQYWNNPTKKDMYIAVRECIKLKISNLINNTITNGIIYTFEMYISDNLNTDTLKQYLLKNILQEFSEITHLKTHSPKIEKIIENGISYAYEHANEHIYEHFRTVANKDDLRKLIVLTVASKIYNLTNDAIEKGIIEGFKLFDSLNYDDYSSRYICLKQSFLKTVTDELIKMFKNNE